MTTPIDIPQTVTQVENPVAQGWKGLKLKMGLKPRASSTAFY